LLLQQQEASGDSPRNVSGFQDATPPTLHLKNSGKNTATVLTKQQKSIAELASFANQESLTPKQRNASYEAPKTTAAPRVNKPAQSSPVSSLTSSSSDIQKLSQAKQGINNAIVEIDNTLLILLDTIGIVASHNTIPSLLAASKVFKAMKAELLSVNGVIVIPQSIYSFTPKATQDKLALAVSYLESEVKGISAILKRIESQLSTVNSVALITPVLQAIMSVKRLMKDIPPEIC